MCSIRLLLIPGVFRTLEETFLSHSSRGLQKSIMCEKLTSYMHTSLVAQTYVRMKHFHVWAVCTSLFNSTTTKVMNTIHKIKHTRISTFCELSVTSISLWLMVVATIHTFPNMFLNSFFKHFAHLRRQAFCLRPVRPTQLYFLRLVLHLSGSGLSSLAK